MVAASILLLAASGCLTYEAFAVKVVDTKCAENARCSPSGVAGDCELYEVPGADDCAFDPGAAARCLHDSWECNQDQPGFEFAEPPTACDVVCVPPVVL